MPRSQAENTEKKNQKERRVMSQKERVDLIEVDLLDMCKYILSKWVFILIGMVVLPKTSSKVRSNDSASEMAYDYVKLVKTDLVVNKIAKESKVSKDDIKEAISAEVIDGTRLIEIKVNSDNKKKVEKISKEVLPVLQNVVQTTLGRNKLVVANQPSKIEAEQNVSVKKYAVVGAIGGFVIVAGVFFVMYLVNLTKKAKENIG